MSRFRRLRESFWAVPAGLVVVAVLLAHALLLVDTTFGDDVERWIPTTLVLGVEGSRGILAAIGGSVLATAGTTFSITISVIATASSTYGPRLVRNFMADWRNQTVLGLFVATFVYSLMVLRAVTSEDVVSGRGAFVPYVAVYVAIVLALVNVAALVFFLHHIADSIQVATLARRVRVELEQVARALYGVEETADRIDTGVLPGAVTIVLADSTGFVVQLDTTALVQSARRHGAVVEIMAGPGQHIVEGEPLARTSGGGDALSADVRRHVRLGDTRTPGQDIRFAVKQLVEMAVRAVSPSMNDPYTARNALDELASGLMIVLRNPEVPPGWPDEAGRPRLVWHPVTAEELVDEVYDDLRTYAASDPSVVAAAIELAGRLTRVARPAPAARIHEQLDQLLGATERSGVPDFDLARLRLARGRLTKESG